MKTKSKIRSKNVKSNLAHPKEEYPFIYKDRNILDIVLVRGTKECSLSKITDLTKIPRVNRTKEIYKLLGFLSQKYDIKRISKSKYIFKKLNKKENSKRMIRINNRIKECKSDFEFGLTEKQIIEHVQEEIGTNILNYKSFNEVYELRKPIRISDISKNKVKRIINEYIKENKHLYLEVCLGINLIIPRRFAENYGINHTILLTNKPQDDENPNYFYDFIINNNGTINSRYNYLTLFCDDGDNHIFLTDEELKLKEDEDRWDKLMWEDM